MRWSTLEVDPRYGLAWISVPAGAMERYGVSSEDLDGIVEHPRSIAGTRLALFFRDLGHGKVKVSFRSTGDVDVNALARAVRRRRAREGCGRAHPGHARRRARSGRLGRPRLRLERQLGGEGGVGVIFARRAGDDVDDRIRDTLLELRSLLHFRTQCGARTFDAESGTAVLRVEGDCPTARCRPPT